MARQATCIFFLTKLPKPICLLSGLLVRHMPYVADLRHICDPNSTHDSNTALCLAMGLLPFCGEGGTVAYTLDCRMYVFRYSCNRGCNNAALLQFYRHEFQNSFCIHHVHIFL